MKRKCIDTLEYDTGMINNDVQENKFITLNLIQQNVNNYENKKSIDKRKYPNE